MCKGIFSIFLVTILLSLTACVFLDSTQTVRSGDVLSTDLSGVMIAGLHKNFVS